MNIDKRIEILENLVESLIETINNSKFYTDADISGVRKNVSDITPYKETKTAYYNESEKTFYNVPDGNVSVFFNNYNGNYSVKRLMDMVTVSFDKLNNATEITIKVE